MKCPYEFEGINTDDIIFADIETTGFSSKINVIYEIGCIIFQNEVPVIVQFLAEKYAEEEDVLKAFFDLCKTKKLIIHFNGNMFDIPFMKTKAAQYEIAHPFDDMEGIDIYKRIAPFKDYLKLENCKQKTVEKFLGIDREDELSGGDLIKVYKAYAKHGGDDLEKLLVLHNHDDMKGMLSILPVLKYRDLLMSKFRVVKVFAERNGDTSFVNIKMIFTISIPKPFDVKKDGFEFEMSEDTAFLRAPLYEGELKYFYKDYKDYYYLPDEDMALHKSVAAFVDKDHRKQAKAYNCYTRKESVYLPGFDEVLKPSFKKSYEDKKHYFEVTDELKKDPESFRVYALNILENLLSK